MEEESIYNIIPKEYVPAPKQPRYKSKYPPNLPPTGSTFCLNTTSKPGIANLSGEFALPPSAHTSYGETQTLGHLKGQRKPSPDNFRKKRTGTMGDNSLPPVKQYNYECTRRKDPVPKVSDKPILGLKSNKNFIVTNAVENILSVPKAQKEEPNWLAKKDFGKAPEYLQKIKQNIHNQYKMIQNLQSKEPEDKILLNQQQIEDLRAGLKRKWEQVNKEYQSITHKSKIDTIGLKRKKESCEEELAQLENDIRKLNKMYIFVDTQR